LGALAKLPNSNSKISLKQKKIFKHALNVFVGSKPNKYFLKAIELTYKIPNMVKPSWQFDIIYGRESGASKGMIESFEGNYNYYLPREVIQNVRDAHDPDTGKPAKVVFDLQYFTPNMFPGYDEFVDILKKGKEFWPPENEKEHNFLDNALKCISAGQIPVLKISDFNTYGLDGDEDDRKSPWYALVKAEGATSKYGSEGGSFGLGKGAPLAASYLRTIFYSTVNRKGENIFQGVAEIVSHFDDEKRKKAGSGSYGLPLQRSIRDKELIDSHFLRKDVGLDIYIMGYKVEENWKEALSESVLRNFWPAIQANLLEVDIGGILLNSANLEEVLTERYINEPFKDSSTPEGNPLKYFEALKDGKFFSDHLKNLGEVKFYFLRVEDPLNRVAMIRKSKMVIYTRDFRWHAPYAGVFICDSDEGNKELRRMEPPEHDKWDKDRNRNKGKEIDKELTKFIRGALKSLTTVKSEGEIEIPELHKYLPYSQDGSHEGSGNRSSGIVYTGKEGIVETSKEIGTKESLERSVESSVYRVEVKNKSDNNAGKKKNQLVRGIGEGKEKKKSKKRASDTGKNEGEGNLSIKMTSRIFLKEIQEPYLNYRVIIKSEEEKMCSLKLHGVGEEGVEQVEIAEVMDETGKNYLFNGSLIKNVTLTKDKSFILDIKLVSKFKISLKVEGYANI
jgi:hypothetical protein